MKPHPDDNIFKVKDFINELSKVQEVYFEKLCKDLKIEEGSHLKDHLFDYVYNENKPITFGEYLDILRCGDLWEGL
jgi:hypothetical protein